MTDLEIVKKCAEKMGVNLFVSGATGQLVYLDAGETYEYDPLHDGAQAMDLVKKFRLDIDSGFDSSDDGEGWTVCGTGAVVKNADLNRAICECVARLP